MEEPVHWCGHRTGRADIVTKSRDHEASKNVAGPGVVEESSLRPLDGQPARLAEDRRSAKTQTSGSALCET